MKASELRIGNWINDGDGDFTVCRKTLAHVEKFPNKFKPIPLTEEWLVKFGFEKIKENTYSAPVVSFLIYTNQKKYAVSFWQGNELEHVHQLQNLYFALVGEELTIKE